jgi:hypothetical protein
MKRLLALAVAAGASLVSSGGLAAQSEPSSAAVAIQSDSVGATAAMPSLDEVAIRGHYRAHPHDYDEYELSHIFISTTEPRSTGKKPRTPRAALALAEEIASRLRKGESFEKMAAQYSEDDATRADGGRLPSMFRIDMLPVFEGAVPGLAPGQVSRPILGPHGIHLVRLDARHSADFERAKGLIEVELQESHRAQAASATQVGAPSRTGAPEVPPDHP